MEERKFKIGDVVHLNSEAASREPVLMTVTDAAEEIKNIECSWFAGGIVMSEWFPPEALTAFKFE